MAEKFISNGGTYTQRTPEKKVAFVRIFSVSEPANLAFGRKVLKDGREVETHVVYNLSGVYLCGKPEEDLVAAVSPQPLAETES